MILSAAFPTETDDLPSIDSDSELEEDHSTSKEHSDFLNPVLVSQVKSPSF